MALSHYFCAELPHVDDDPEPQHYDVAAGLLAGRELGPSDRPFLRPRQSASSRRDEDAIDAWVMDGRLPSAVQVVRHLG